MIMENEQNTPNPANQNEPKGQRENEESHHTSLASDGPVSQNRSQGKSDLQDTDDPELDDLSGDLSGNASGNSDAEDQ